MGSRDRVIPNAVILTRADPTGQLPPAAMNDAAKTDVQLIVAGRDSYIPIIYGGPERIGGMLYLARIYQGKLLLCLILGEGPIQEIDAVELNDAALTGGFWVFNVRTFSNGVTIHRHLGADVAVDAALAAAIPGFNEPMTGTAYIVALIPQGASQGFPRLTVEAKGMLVYDPRGTPTTAWSDNPALILADFLTSLSYGARKDIDWASVGTAADYCDEMIGSPAEKRSTLTITLADKRSVREWQDVLRAYVPCWVVMDGQTALMIPDKPGSSAHTFTADNIASSPRPKIRKRGIRDVPTVVEIGYMRTDVKPWAIGYAEASTGASVRRKARIDMPGIRRYSQARRFAIERLNHYVLEDIEGEIGVFEDGLRVREGDIATITDDIGLTAKEVRVLSTADGGHGRWRIGWREYDPAAYSSVVETVGSTPDTGLPDPRVVPAATSLAIEEVVYLESDIAADSLGRGLIYQSRFEVTWTASTYAYPKTYRVQFLDGTRVIHEGTTHGLVYASPAVQQGKTYTVRVFVRAGIGFESDPLEGTEAALGKLLPPGNVPAIKQAFELGGRLFLEIDPAVDIDVIRYEWRYGPTSGFSWDGATVIDRVDGLRPQFTGLPVGTWRIAVKAIDSVGLYSPVETTVDVTITSDASAFVQSSEFTSPTLTEMVEIPMIEGEWKRRWATSVTGDTWNNMGGGAAAMNTLANPLISYHSSADQRWQGESWDLGFPVSGDWTLTANTINVTGTATYAIETSPDGSTWTAQPGISWKGSTRFVRPAITNTATGTMIVSAPKISVAAFSRYESGSVTTLASGGKLVELTGLYAGAQDLQAIAINTSSPRLVVADRILLYPETGLMLTWDQAAGDGYVAQSISTSPYTIASGDYVEYDVYIDSSTPSASAYSCGALLLHYTTPQYHNAISDPADANGYALWGASTGMDPYARGKWYARKVQIGAGAHIGKTIDSVLIGGNSDGVGTSKIIYRNIRITDGASTVHKSYWTSGEPANNATTFSAFVSNVRCGPSNSFNLYAFISSTGAQLAQQVQYSFRGF